MKKDVPYEMENPIFYYFARDCVRKAVNDYSAYLASDKSTEDFLSSPGLSHDPMLDSYQIEFLNEIVAESFAKFYDLLRSALLVHGIDLYDKDKIKDFFEDHPGQ